MEEQTGRQQVVILVQLADGVLRLQVPRQRLFSWTTYAFVLWTIGMSLILLGIATIFMRNQVRPVRRLARAADAFGKGREVQGFRPEGAREVKQAARAFLAMKNRIQRQITQRTTMLAGVSHDLRTPLTRMKLQLEMMPVDDEGIQALQEDVHDMEKMLEGYLAFARGEGTDRDPSRGTQRVDARLCRRHRRRAGRLRRARHDRDGCHRRDRRRDPSNSSLRHAVPNVPWPKG